MGHILSLTDSSRSDDQEMIRLLWNPNLTAAFRRNRHSIPLASRRMYYTPSYHIHDQFQYYHPTYTDDSKVVSSFQVFQVKYCKRLPSFPCLLHALLILPPFVSSSSKYFVVKQIIKLITPFSSASHCFLFSSTRLFSCQIMEKLNICHVMLNTQTVRITKHTTALY